VIAITGKSQRGQEGIFQRRVLGQQVVLLENKAQLMDFLLEVERGLILQLKMLMVMN